MLLYINDLNDSYHIKGKWTTILQFVIPLYRVHVKLFETGNNIEIKYVFFVSLSPYHFEFYKKEYNKFLSASVRLAFLYQKVNECIISGGC